MEIYHTKTSNQEIIKFFEKDELFYEYLNPSSDEMMKKIESMLVKTYGKKEVLKFNKLIMQDLKDKGIIWKI